MIRCCLCRATEKLEPSSLPGSGFRCTDQDYCRERVRSIVSAHIAFSKI